MTLSSKTKFIFITGGVVSSLGKGLASASLATILQGRGFKVRLKKLDPYLNVDPGTMSPYQHGEVYVTDDGTEADLDLGHYERFSGVATTKYDSVTSGKIYQSVINKERKGDYLGATIQVVPHVTNAIKDFIFSDLTDEDFVQCEIGGTVGDIEGQPYLEAIRQIAYELGKDRVMFIHLTLLPYIPTAGELKTKPTQHSVKKLQEYGIQPDMLLCRSQMPIDQNEKRKLALFCNVKEENVITALDVGNIYEVPLAYAKEGIDRSVCTHFGIECKEHHSDLSKWQKIVDIVSNPQHNVKIAVVGKYAGFLEAYKSLSEAIKHAAIANCAKADVAWVDSEKLETEPVDEVLKNVDAIIVPGGFGKRGTEGKIMAIKYAREHQIPFLGICLGMQMAVIETLRHVGKIEKAGTTEFDPDCTPVVGLLTEWQHGLQTERRNESTDLGGTMRLGAYPCVLQKGSKVSEIYNTLEISERHRHRYEINTAFERELNNSGMFITGKSPSGNLAEIVERKDHPWFIAVQFHPELKSKPFAAHPLFVSLLQTAIKWKKNLI